MTATVHDIRELELKKSIQEIIKMGRYFYLDGKIVKPVTTTEQFLTCWEKENRQIIRNEFGKVLVSTVFIPIDHSFSYFLGDKRSDPVVFETMIFEGIYDGYCKRYSSYDSAMSGHYQAVLLAKHGLRWKERIKYFFTKKRTYET